MEFLLFGSTSLTNLLLSHGYSGFPDIAPFVPKMDNYAIIIEDWYPSENRTIIGKYEAIKFRKKYCQKPIIIISRGTPPPANPSWERVLQDPLVKEISIEEIRNTPLNPALIEDIFPTNLTLSELDHFYADLRKNFYDNASFIATERHHILTELQQLKELQKAATYLHENLQNLTYFLSREQLIKHVQKDLENARDMLTRADNLSAVTDIASMVYETIREKISAQENILAQRPDAKTILYVGSQKETWLNFCTSLDEFFGQQLVKCQYARNEFDATNILEHNPHISIVFTDFRFWKNNGTLEPMNGYILVNRLQQKIPGLRFCFLTNQLGDLGLLPEQMTTEHVFNKKKIIKDQDPLECARLLKVIFYENRDTVELRWPIKLNAQTDQLYIDNFEKHLRSPNRQLQLKKSNALANTIVRQLVLNGETKHLDLFRHAPYNKITEEGQLDYLLQILTARKVVVGLLNVKSLPQKYAYLLRSEERKYDNQGAHQRPHFDIIYALLSPGTNATIDGSKKVSRFFTDTFRIKVRVDYSFNNPRLEEYLTLDEIRWLRTFLITNNEL